MSDEFFKELKHLYLDNKETVSTQEMDTLRGVAKFLHSYGIDSNNPKIKKDIDDLIEIFKESPKDRNWRGFDKVPPLDNPKVIEVLGKLEKNLDLINPGYGDQLHSQLRWDGKINEHLAIEAGNGFRSENSYPTRKRFNHTTNGDFFEELDNLIAAGKKYGTLTKAEEEYLLGGGEGRSQGLIDRLKPEIEGTSGKDRASQMAFLNIAVTAAIRPGDITIDGTHELHVAIDKFKKAFSKETTTTLENEASDFLSKRSKADKEIYGGI
jgi:hypothetical protein